MSKPRYAEFDAEEQGELRHLTAYQRAYEHACIAEEHLADTHSGVYTISPPNHTAAAVHAQLALAWAAIANTEETR